MNWTRFLDYLLGPRPEVKRLDCGCPEGGVMYGCIYCWYTHCPEHDGPHDCPECPGCGIRYGRPVHGWADGRLVEAA